MDFSLIGRGWSLPLNLSRQQSALTLMPRGNEQGQLVSLTNETNEIEQAMQIILTTIPGERVMRPTFGCQIHDLVFEPNNRATAVQAERYVAEALSMWEPRIQVNQVEARPDDAKLLIRITYTINASSDERSLVYPFYLIPGE